MNVLPTALAAMDQAQTQFDKAASRIAASQTPSGDAVDLSAEAVNLLQARTEFDAGTRLAGTADDMVKHLLNVTG
jgi:flagellar hook-associated protein FlgK